jgi:curved DNA-binding protein CbpA
MFSACKNKEEVKATYRRLSKEYHPDKGGTNEKMADLTKQYEAAMKRDFRKKVDPKTQKEEEFQFGSGSTEVRTQQHPMYADKIMKGDQRLKALYDLINYEFCNLISYSKNSVDEILKHLTDFGYITSKQFRFTEVMLMACRSENLFKVQREREDAYRRRKEEERIKESIRLNRQAIRAAQQEALRQEKIKQQKKEAERQQRESERMARESERLAADAAAAAERLEKQKTADEQKNKSWKQKIIDTIKSWFPQS